MGRVFVSWSSKKQRTVSTSTTEAEYTRLGHILREGAWVRRFFNEMALGKTTEVMLNGNNETILSLTKNPEAQHRTKHIDVLMKGMIESE